MTSQSSLSTIIRVYWVIFFYYIDRGLLNPKLYTKEKRTSKKYMILNKDFLKFSSGDPWPEIRKYT